MVCMNASPFVFLGNLLARLCDESIKRGQKLEEATRSSCLIPPDLRRYEINLEGSFFFQHQSLSLLAIGRTKIWSYFFFPPFFRASAIRTVISIVSHSRESCIVQDDR